MIKLRLSLPFQVILMACVAFVTFALGMTTHEAYVRYHPAYLELPTNKPMIGRPTLSGYGPDEDQEHLMLDMPVCNRSPYPLNISIKILGNPLEVSWVASGCTQPSGGDCEVGIGRVSRQRRQSVYVYIDWQRGPKSGKEAFTIAPQEDTTILQTTIFSFPKQER